MAEAKRIRNRICIAAIQQNMMKRIANECCGIIQELCCCIRSKKIYPRIKENTVIHLNLFYMHVIFSVLFSFVFICFLCLFVCFIVNNIVLRVTLKI